MTAPEAINAVRVQTDAEKYAAVEWFNCGKVTQRESVIYGIAFDNGFQKALRMVEEALGVKS